MPCGVFQIQRQWGPRRSFEIQDVLDRVGVLGRMQQSPGMDDGGQHADQRLFGLVPLVHVDGHHLVFVQVKVPQQRHEEGIEEGPFHRVHLLQNCKSLLLGCPCPLPLQQHPFYNFGVEDRVVPFVLQEIVVQTQHKAQDAGCRHVPDTAPFAHAIHVVRRWRLCGRTGEHGTLDVLAPAATQLCQVCEQQPETSTLTSHGHVQ
mmetsp:Transcript_7133/g.17103  ORF Transcript_7133/g.17103 Transcript_7133/m.17103 type:complete len:204 (+) Transcript_7133:252-863(+)